MKSLTENLKTVKAALLTVTSEVYHYRRPEGKKAAYIVWAEDGSENSFRASNKTQEQQIHGTIDFFTLTEFDPLVDEIQAALNGVCGWRLDTVDYEDDTNLIHYVWEFWVA